MIDFYAQIPVCKQGYVWHGRGEDRVHSWLDPRFDDPQKPCAPLSDDSVWRFYDPFSDEPSLFRIFADLEPYPSSCRDLTTEEIGRFCDMILGFADKYGRVEVNAPFIMHWLMQVRLMRAAIELWEGICSKGKNTLGKYLHFFEAGEYSYDYRACDWWDYVQRRFGKPEKLKGWGLRDTPITAAIRDVPQHWHSESRTAKDLLACASDLFMLLIQSQTHEKATITVARASVASLPAVRIQVDGLLQSLWIQLAVSLVERRDYRRCKMCNKPFEVGTKQGGRTVPRDKLFCSDSCRVRWCQSKQRLARKMRSEGAKLRDIANAVDSDMEQVKKWLGEKG
jgi:hypothetical protein